jgi:hypothetical protein
VGIAAAMGERLKERCNTVLQPTKSFLWQRNTVELKAFLRDNAAVEFVAGHLDPTVATTAEPGSGFGIVISGIPYGEEAFVNAKLKAKLDNSALGKIQKITKLLRYVNAQALSAITVYCFQPLLMYEMQMLAPSVLHEILVRFDAAMLDVVGIAAGDDYANPAGGDVVTLARVRLPKRLHGGAVRSMVDVAPAAFVGSLINTLPSMMNVPAATAGGTAIPGLAPHLADVFGADSFKPGNEAHRFDRLIASGAGVGQLLQEHWNALRAEVQAPDGTFPHNGPLTVEAAAAGWTGAGTALVAKPQHAITLQREEGRVEELRRMINDLDINDERRIAYYSENLFSTQFVGSVPLPGCEISNSELYEIYATYYGRPSPACAPFIGSRFKTSMKKNGSYERVLDAYGHELESACLRGDGRRQQHNDILFTLFDLDHCYDAYLLRKEVYGIFRSLIHDVDRLEREMWARARQGLVPDFTIKTKLGGLDLGDVKTVTVCPSRYEPKRDAKGPTHGTAVDRRGAAVHGEYAYKAKVIDRKYNGIAKDAVAPGPVARKLAEFGRVQGLAFGAYGEASEDVFALLDEIARVGAIRGWRDMGCNNELAARGILTQMTRHALGIAVVRANARLLLDRVVTVTGRAGCDEARKRRKKAHFGWRARRNARSRLNGFARSQRFDGHRG